MSKAAERVAHVDALWAEVIRLGREAQAAYDAGRWGDCWRLLRAQGEAKALWREA